MLKLFSFNLKNGELNGFNMNYLHVNKEANYNNGNYTSQNGDSATTIHPNDINRTKSISRSLRSLFGRSSGQNKKAKARDMSNESNIRYPIPINAEGKKNLFLKFII